jgi:hypothetical protein
MFALIMNAIIILQNPSTSDIDLKRAVLNIYIYGNMCCC